MTFLIDAGYKSKFILTSMMLIILQFLHLNRFDASRFYFIFDRIMQLVRFFSSFLRISRATKRVGNFNVSAIKSGGIVFLRNVDAILLFYLWKQETPGKLLFHINMF